MIKKNDLILVAVLLCIALMGMGVVRLLQSEDGAGVTVSIGGSVYGTYSLNQYKVIEIEDDMGYNRIVIDNGYVYMEEADCPDQYCVSHAKIHYSNESIICLPHEMVVSISSDEESDVDITIR